MLLMLSNYFCHKLFRGLKILMFFYFCFINTVSYSQKSISAFNLKTAPVIDGV